MNISYDINKVMEFEETPKKLTIEIPRALLDSKDSTGKDDDFMAGDSRKIYADKYSRILEIYNLVSGTSIDGTTSSYFDSLNSKNKIP